MNDRTFQNNVRQALDQSANRIDQATLVKLREARSKAIEQFDARQAVPEFSWAGLSTKFGFAPGSHRRLYYWLAAILLVAAVLNGAAYWQHVQDNDDVEADIAILTDDMPIDVYLD
ncbi:MAG: DUF3619 family protein [Gallionellaceae bacterium]